MDPLKTLKHSLSTLRLSDAERSAMREVLLTRMRATAAEPRIPSPYGGIFMTLTFQRTTAFLAVFAVLVSSAGGVSLAAEDAVPGDAMYALKVNVNEPLYTLTAVTPSAKAAVATSRAERRLKEAEVLAARGSLDETAVAELSERFHDSADEAASHIEELSDTAPEKSIDASVELESVLSAHGRIIDDIIAARNGDTEEALAMLRVDIAEKKEKVALERDESDVPSKEASEHVLADAARDAEVAVRDLAERSEGLTAEDSLAIGNRVALITEAIDSGKAKHELGAYQGAVADFARAKTAIGVGKRLLEAKFRFETPEEEVATDAFVEGEVAAEPAAEVATLSAPAMMKVMATTSATTTASSTEEAVENVERPQRRSGSWYRPIRIDLAP
ncbi:MAG: hypothetical protein KBD05_01750 [Candidatus Pacebacteria bacterium]|nr:hypothetical protein [Candidatus Paceibacterota bacterium]